MKPKREITALIEIEDDDFLSQVAKAEANALSGSDFTKRRKITSVDSNMKNDDDQEGDYIAALRGSKSALWQQRIKAMNSTSSDYNRSDGNRSGGMVMGSGGSDPLVSEKMCPCGLGACNVFTANTERNRGRSFYKCPQRQENGGCGFFQWCDSDGSATSNTFTAGGSGRQGYGTTNSMLFPDLPCPCGAGSCLVLTAKTGNNIGKQFYKCPANQGSSCGFFKWCNDDTAPAGVQPSAYKIYYNTNDFNNKSYAVKTGSSCFKCGKEGHWAKDCSVSSSDSPAAFGAMPGLSGTCYKCGKPGHWARDCTSSQYMNVRQQY